MAMDTYKVQVTGTPDSPQVQATARDFTVTLAPQSQQHAGSYETIMEALGACESIVMASFHRQQKFQYRSFYYTLTGTPDGDHPQRGLRNIGVNVHFQTPEKKAACEAFMDFAENTCPVMDNLTNTVPITRTGVTVL